jgi:transposase-like protein
MHGKKHTEEQIIAILKQTDNRLKTAEVCRQHGISEQTLYRADSGLKPNTFCSTPEWRSPSSRSQD